mmetsp:Transcript_6738/g.16449  ORF Transcript_6738/g.16449 Transcript_6738/m.16449 type:complete len:472 (-) Transcript_6738:103-1518(-)
MMSCNTTNFPQRRQRQRPQFVSAIFSAIAVTAVIFSPAIQPLSRKFEAEAFTIPRSSQRLILRQSHPIDSLRRFSSVDENQAIDVVTSDDADEPSAVRAPLKFIGPYPCMALRFPNLATESQRSQNKTGISLDFVLDTAANINTLQGQVAQELKLEILEDSPALPGVSSSGPMGGGETYILGDSELEQAKVLGESDEVDSNEPFEFMQNLTAAALPVVNPGSAGLLGLAFFYCFEGGVEFNWGSQAMQPSGNEQRLADGMVTESKLGDQSSPSITFYGKNDDSQLQSSLAELTRVSIDPIPLTQLPSVQLEVNGVEMIALLDTGSPITVLNEQAAKAAGIQTTKENLESASKEESGGWNPFAGVVDKLKEAQAQAEAASRGEILMIGGIDGKPTTLYRSNGPSSISLVGSSGEDVPLGSADSNKVYVGEIPGLAALNGIGVDSPPAVVLGLDVLRQRPRMVFRPRENEFFV